jgi:hypothetical protein
LLALQPCAPSVYNAVPERAGVVCDSIHTNGCRPETQAECHDRRRTVAQAIAEVSGGQRVLAALMAAVWHGESGGRRDVQTGQGKHARGDKGMSWGVFQRLLGAGTTSRGWFGRDLVGLDLLSMRRAAATAGGDLMRARSYCTFVGARDRDRCTINVYGGLPTLVSNDRRVNARLRGFAKALTVFRSTKAGHVSNQAR